MTGSTTLTRPGTEREFSAGAIDALRPYVVNLSEGEFSADGAMTTRRADVDAIFDVHLPAFVNRFPGRVPLVVWAHGGLVAESTGLTIARNQIDWWLANGVYPLHFVWESGFFDALRNVLTGGARDLADYTSDPIVEALARPLGSRIWESMKSNAAQGSHGRPGDPDIGGARYVARRLADFGRRYPDRVDVHAVGHSAGAIFHSHFIPAALEEGADPFASLQLLAPAVRVDEFLTRLRSRIGNGIQDLTMYTMDERTERDDNCAQVYRKSLLYLVSRALEPQQDAPILGLEESVRRNAELMGLFGPASGSARVVWSPSPGGAGPRSRSSSRSHGGFDNDVDTMNSVARRILGRDAITGFPPGTRSVGFELAVPSLGSPVAVTPPEVVNTNGGASRKALCVGIDAYPEPYRLGGCVADMNAWAGLLRGKGFRVTTLSDGAATRAGILNGLRELIRTAVPGDVLAFQYSGHGTQVPDDDGDERRPSAPNDDQDEALCPVDFADGALIIDDELFAEFAALPDGVSLTVFFDCCHSGTLSKALTIDRAVPPRDAGLKRRYMSATPALVAAHRGFRQGQRAAGAEAVGIETDEQLRSVSISACQDDEVAYESNGQGHFTRFAMQVFGQGDADLTNRTFTDQVTACFGPMPAQRPHLFSRPEDKDRPLLSAAAITADGRANTANTANTNGSAAPVRAAAADLLRATAALLEAG